MAVKTLSVIALRHGEKDKDGNLVPDAAPKLYTSANEMYGCEFGFIYPTEIGTVHSGEERVKQSVFATALGMLNMGEILDTPDLENTPQHFDVREEAGLHFKNLTFNYAHYKKVGEPQYITEMMADPSSILMDGQLVSPFTQPAVQMASTMKGIIDKGIAKNKDLVVAGSHAVMMEGLLAVYGSSTHGTLITDPSEFGGIVKMGDTARINIAYNSKSGTIVNARITRGDFTAPINLEYLK